MKFRKCKWAGRNRASLESNKQDQTNTENYILNTKMPCLKGASLNKWAEPLPAAKLLNQVHLNIEIEHLQNSLKRPVQNYCPFPLPRNCSRL